MINTKLERSLEEAIEKWMDENCEEDWWEKGIGYVSNDCSARLARICALTLEESKLGQEMVDE